MSKNDLLRVNDQYAAPGGVMIEHNKAVKDLAYFSLHRPAWIVATTPGITTGTTTSKVKTATTTVLMVNGVAKSLTATDDFWTLVADAANTLAAGYCRVYQLCWDGTSATTVMSVRPSNDQSIAVNGSAALALAACRYPTLPPDGTVIVGLLKITNTTNTFVPGTTLLGATGVTAAYVDGHDANCMLGSMVQG